MNKPEFWIEIFMPAEPQAREAVSALLFESGCTGTEERENGLLAWFDPRGHPIAGLRKEVKARISRLRLSGLHAGPPRIRRIKNRNWNRAWRAWYKPVCVTPSLLVRPPWEKRVLQPGQQELLIMPRMAFGTGTHETTQLCLILLERMVNAGDRVLDIGTGSGILAVAAVKLNAGQVTAFDIHADCLSNAVENAGLNRTGTGILFFCGTLDSLRPIPHDIITVNINASVLLSLMPAYRSYLAEDGRIILSGILESECGKLKKAAHKYGYRLVETVQKGEWIGAVISYQ
jgi:ribosomal protein L11 methyltransferase